MLTSLGLIFLMGLAAGAAAQRLGLPRIVGMLLAGILMGPYVLGLLDPSILEISAQLRKLALIIILLKAGLSLDLSDLRKVGRPAILMSFVPASCEILAFVLLAPPILGISRVEGAVMGAVLGAVSPAVVVPRMVQLMEERFGTAQGIPQLILAGASCDDVFVIVVFSAFVGAAQGDGIRLADLAGVPVSILSGLMLGAVTGWLLEGLFVRGRGIKSGVKVIIILGVAFLLVAAEDRLAEVLPLSGLLAVMGMACVLKGRGPAEDSARLAGKLGELWLAAEVVLFVLVGAAVDIRYTLEAGLPAVGMILLALLFRAAGVILCMAGTALDRRERLFCVIAYLPKATVQAAIGAVPLSLGLPCGKIVLSVAVLAILITAPLGAFGIDRSYRKLLKRE